MESKTRNLKIVSMFALEEETIKKLQSHQPFDLHMLKGRVSRGDQVKSVAGAFGLIVGPLVKVDKELLDAAGPQLKVVSSFSAGYEHIDLNECSARKVRVGYYSDIGADILGEFTVALLLSVSRRITESVLLTRGQIWDFYDPETGAIFDRLPGKSLKNSTVGIFGLGQMGINFVKCLAGFNVKKIIYRNRKPNPKADELGCEFVSFERLLSESDFVICACSVSQETTGIFNMKAFEQMKPTSIFINVSRGVTVNQDDLYEALSKQIILAAGLDVTSPEPLPASHKLYTLNNCIITPHIAWMEEKANRERFDCVVNNILHVLDHTDSEKGIYLV